MDVGVKKGIQMWYYGVSDYDFATGNSKGGVTGHFTALVWKASQKLGNWTFVRKKTALVILLLNSGVWPVGNMGGGYLE